MAWCKHAPCPLLDTVGQDPPSLTIREGPIAVGDILRVDASLSQPIRKAIAVAKIGDYSAFSKDQIHRLETKKPSRARNLRARSRPALVLMADDPQKPQVCLMGTFEGSDHTLSPSLVRHFLAPVSPTIAHVPEHLHTTPEWRGNGSNQWILALAIQLPNQPMDCRWQDDGGAVRGHYFLNNKARNNFALFCKMKLRSWLAKSTPLKQADAREYDEWQANTAKVFGDGQTVRSNATSSYTAFHGHGSLYTPSVVSGMTSMSNMMAESPFSALPAAPKPALDRVREPGISYASSLLSNQTSKTKEIGSAGPENNLGQRFNPLNMPPNARVATSNNTLSDQWSTHISAIENQSAMTRQTNVSIGPRSSLAIEVAELPSTALPGAATGTSMNPPLASNGEQAKSLSLQQSGHAKAKSEDVMRSTAEVDDQARRSSDASIAKSTGASINGDWRKRAAPSINERVGFSNKWPLGGHRFGMYKNPPQPLQEPTQLSPISPTSRPPPPPTSQPLSPTRYPNSKLRGGSPVFATFPRHDSPTFTESTAPSTPSSSPETPSSLGASRPVLIVDNSLRVLSNSPSPSPFSNSPLDLSDNEPSTWRNVDKGKKADRGHSLERLSADLSLLHFDNYLDGNVDATREHNALFLEEQLSTKFVTESHVDRSAVERLQPRRSSIVKPTTIKSEAIARATDVGASRQSIGISHSSAGSNSEKSTFNKLSDGAGIILRGARVRLRKRSNAHKATQKVL